MYVYERGGERGGGPTGVKSHPLLSSPHAHARTHARAYTANRVIFLT